MPFFVAETELKTVVKTYFFTEIKISIGIEHHFEISIQIINCIGFGVHTEFKIGINV